MRAIEDGALSGAYVARHRELLRARGGRGVVDAALAGLPPDVREAILKAPAPGWVPVDAVEAMFTATAAALGCDVVSLHTEIVTTASDQVIHSVWRVLLRLTSDAHLITQVPVLYRKAWNRGMLNVDSQLGNGARLVLAGWPGVPEIAIRGLRISIERALLSAGRRDPVATAERSPDGARFVVSWK